MSSTIADALAVQTPFPEAVARLRASVDDILLVDDAALVVAAVLTGGNLTIEQLRHWLTH